MRAATCSRYAAAVHEGIHGGRKVKNRTSGFKWLRKALLRSKKAFYDRAIAVIRGAMK